MTKKILILYATAGTGHKKAALAIKKALDETAGEDVEISIVDALDYAPPFFKWTYLNLYLVAVHKLSLVWGIMYYLTDNFYVNLFIGKIRRLNNWLNSQRLSEHLATSNPDVIISTHFFPSEVASDLKKRGLLKSHLVTVVTDYRLHAWWVSYFVDTYVVSNRYAKDDLMRWRIPESKIAVIGIPVEPEFSRPLDKENIRNKLGLKKDLFMVLVISGGFGIGPIEGIVKAIDRAAKPIQMIVVCGHNEALVERIESLKHSLKAEIKILGFVDNVYELMEVADILVSKSGGITVSESLAKELPIIVISPILGQETGNSDFLVKHGAALRIDKLPELSKVIGSLVNDPETLKNMREAIRAIKKPMAAYDIAKLSLHQSQNR